MEQEKETHSMKTFFEEWLTDTTFVLASVLLSLVVLGVVAWRLRYRGKDRGRI